MLCAVLGSILLSKALLLHGWSWRAKGGSDRVPVLGERSLEPKEVLMVVVKDTALRRESTTDK